VNRRSSGLAWRATLPPSEHDVDVRHSEITVENQNAFAIFRHLKRNIGEQGRFTNSPFTGRNTDDTRAGTAHTLMRQQSV
jgi:hypothetical protein